VTVSGDHMVLDFEGSAPACEGPMNLTRPTTVTACYTGLKHLFPDIPINAGCFRPVEVRIPAGCLLAADPPHAVGGYAESSARVVGLVSQAMVEALPDVPGTSFETGGTTIISGLHEGKVFVAAFPYGGGYGGSPAGDGLVNGTSAVGMATFPSIEVTEREYPIRWNAFAIREGSGGSGRWAGGCGNEYDFSVEVQATLSILGEQALFPPNGVVGGEAGAPNEVAFTVGGAWRGPDLGAKVAPLRLEPGDRVRTRSPGGGGYGKKEERAEEAIARDVLLGYLDAEQARERYGFAGAVDSSAVAD
jgi:N-methylhydantoinase B